MTNPNTDTPAHLSFASVPQATQASGDAGAWGAGQPATTPLEKAHAQDRALGLSQYEARAAALSQPTIDRPQLISDHDVAYISKRYQGADVKLQALDRLAELRRDFWWAAEHPREPGRQFTEAETNACIKFFNNHPVRLLPPPEKPKFGEMAGQADRAENREALIESARVKLKVPLDPSEGLQMAAPTPPAPAVGAAIPATREAAIPAIPVWAGSHVELEFTNVDGFIGRIVIHPGTTLEQLGSLLALSNMAVAKLKTSGAKPVSAPGPKPMTAEGGAPMCRYHGAMKPSKKPGAWYCPKKLADGSYCDQKYEESK